MERLNEILHALTKNKLRTTLTAFGVFWGMFMLIVMLSSGNGLRNGVEAGFSGISTNSFFVWGERTTIAHDGYKMGRWVQFKNSDIEIIKSYFPQLEQVAPRNRLGGWRGDESVKRGIKKAALRVYGDYPSIANIADIPLTGGRFINHQDMSKGNKVTVIGTKVKDLLFEPNEDPIGKYVEIQGTNFQVVGVFTTREMGEQAANNLQTLYVPFTTFQKTFGQGERVGWFAFKMKEGVNVEKVEIGVKNMLADLHHVHPDDKLAIGSFNLKKEYDRIQGLFFGINTLVWIVGIGTLLTGVVGISNIMLIVIKERIHEIGIRRAIGATPLNIFSQVIMESVFLTATAGYVGLFLGFWLIEGINKALASQVSDSPAILRDLGIKMPVALISLLILVFCGILAGLIPANKAVKVRPIDAIRDNE